MAQELRRTDARPPQCPVKWCDMGDHAPGTTHFAPIADFEMKGDTRVSIEISDHTLSGQRVLLAVHVGVDDPHAEYPTLDPKTAYGLAKLISALDPAAIIQFARQLSLAAVTLAPELAEESGR